MEQITCNPYNAINNALRLECNAYSSNTTAYEIQWYRILNTENSTVEQLTSDLMDVRVFVSRNRQGAFQMSRLRIRSPSGNDTGVYWCQIAVMEVNEMTELLSPSQKTKLQPPEFYSQLSPCPFSELDESTVRCAMEPFDTPSQVMSSTLPPLSSPLPTRSSSDSISTFTTLKATMSTNNSSVVTDSMGRAPDQVLYGVIASVGVVLVAGIITLVLIAIICHRKCTRQKASREGHNGMPNLASMFEYTLIYSVNLYLTGTIQEVYIQARESTAEQLRRPLFPPAATVQNTPLPHLSVARQPSNDSQYTEVPSRSRKCGAGRISLCRHDTVGTVSSDLQDQHVTHDYKAPTATKMIQDGHVYHTVDPNKCKDQSYTSLSPTRLALPERPRHLRLPLTASDSYTNDVMYKDLSPQTRDYMSIYATTEKQKHNSLSDSP